MLTKYVNSISEWKIKALPSCFRLGLKSAQVTASLCPLKCLSRVGSSFNYNAQLMNKNLFVYSFNDVDKKVLLCIDEGTLSLSPASPTITRVWASWAQWHAMFLVLCPTASSPNARHCSRQNLTSWRKRCFKGLLKNPWVWQPQWANPLSRDLAKKLADTANISASWRYVRNVSLVCLNASI